MPEEKKPKEKKKRERRVHGWAWPRSSTQWHYFAECQSLCGKFTFNGYPAKKPKAGTTEAQICAKCQELNKQRES